MFRTGEEAAEFVMHRQGHHCGYPRFQEVMAKAGNPQDAFRTVHVAGTNGKGSTSSYLAAILRSHGYRTGLYTSPFLVDHRDRIRINGAWIPEDRFRDYVNGMMDLIEEYNMSMFEIDTLAACQYFRDEKVDWAVMEAGVGGRKDATNTIHHPALAILTTVGFDHMNQLGDTLQKIAWEKAGIIKENGHILYGPLVQEAAEEVIRKAEEMHACCEQVEPYEDLGTASFRLFGNAYTLSTAAEYQKLNASLALHAAKILGIDIASPKTVQAVREHVWAGRFETLAQNPPVILDGAHNPEGTAALIRSFENLKRPVITVFSALRDKQGPAMAEMLREKSDRLYVTEFDSYRADTADSFAGSEGEIIYDWKEALEKARQEALVQGGTVVVTGSLYFISDVRKYLAEQN